MFIKSRIIKKLIYSLTKKPEHYVHVDECKTLQDYRQVQYNNWCKAKRVYNGSYLPTKADTLLRKGWIETTPKKNNANRKFIRKSTGQKVRFDPDSPSQIDHYHWYNPSPTKIGYKTTTEYLDRYGIPCTKYDNQHHLAPLDKNCPKNALKRYIK